MDYSEFPAPADLRRHLDCVWLLRDDAPVAGMQTVFPDGRCEIIVHFAEPMRLQQLDGTHVLQTHQLFAGQMRGPIRLQATGALHCLGARLTPTASALLAGKQLPQLRDCIPDLNTLAAEIAPRVIGWKRADIRAWLESRPVAHLPPVARRAKAAA